MSKPPGRGAYGKGTRLGAVFCVCLLAVPALAAVLRGNPSPAAPAAEQDWPTVYLTFDDGPSAITEKVLDILRGHGIQATFFVIGPTGDGSAALCRRIVAEGHSLGLHTYSHDTGRIYASMAGFKTDFEKLRQWIEETTDTSPKICRMVGGSNSYNCPAVLREQILSYLMEAGYSCYDWDIDPKDSGGYALPANRLAQNVIDAAGKKPGQDLIVLLHDDPLRTTLPEALERIIAFFQEEGYAFGRLTEDTVSVRRVLPGRLRSRVSASAS